MSTCTLMAPLGQNWTLHLLLQILIIFIFLFPFLIHQIPKDKSLGITLDYVCGFTYGN